MEFDFKDSIKEEHLDSLYNPLNRFLFLFSHSSKVDSGWAIPILGCKLLPFFLWRIYFFIFNDIIFSK